MKRVSPVVAAGVWLLAGHCGVAQAAYQASSGSEASQSSVYSGAAPSVNQMVTVNAASSSDAVLTAKAQTFLKAYLRGSKITSVSKLSKALVAKNDAALCAKVLQLIGSGYKKVSKSEVSKIVNLVTNLSFLQKVEQKLAALGDAKSAAIVHARVVKLSASQLLSANTKKGTLNATAVAAALQKSNNAELSAAVLLQADSSSSKTRKNAQAIIAKITDKDLLGKIKTALASYSSSTAVVAVRKLVDARSAALKSAAPAIEPAVQAFMDTYIWTSLGIVYFGPTSSVSDALSSSGDAALGAKVLVQVAAGYKGIGKDNLWGLLASFQNTAYLQNVEETLKTMGNTALLATVHVRVMQMRVSNMIVAFSPYYPYGRQLDTTGLAAKLQNDNDPELLGQVLLGANSFGGYVAPGLFDPNTYGNARAIVANITNVTLLKQSLSYITGDSTNPAPGIIKGMVNDRIAALQK